MSPLRVFAVLFAALVISNLAKPIGAEGQGFVFMGRRLEGAPNLIAAWSFAAYLAAYVRALWQSRPHALPMGIAYAAWVSANLFLFQIRMAASDNNPIFGIAYAVLALGASWGAVAVMVREGFAAREAAPGRLVLRSFALLFAVMALSNLLKPFAHAETVGFVLLGQRLSGDANVVASLVFSAFLAAYAAMIWQERRVAVPMGTFYALYVLANLVLWNFRKPDGAEAPLLFAVPYLVSAIGVSGGAAFLLRRHAERFR
jgi:hypothetical protein